MDLRRPAPANLNRGSNSHTLDVTPTERETLLAALEIAGALASGRAADAFRLACEAYPRHELAQAVDQLADKVFALGVDSRAPESAALRRPALVA